MIGPQTADEASESRPERPLLAATAILSAAGPLLLLAVLVVAVFYPCLTYNYIYYDTEQQLLDNPLVRSLSPGNLWRIFTSPSPASYYPMRTLSFAIDYAIWGYRPFGYHLTNLLLHLANVLMVFWLGVRLHRVGRQSDLPSASGDCYLRSLVASFLAAAVLAVHPAVVEPVVWVPGREELLTLLFALGCMHAHMSARGEACRRQARGGEPRRLSGFHVLAAVCCAAACMSNIAGAAVPLLVTAHDLAMSEKPRFLRILRAGWVLYLLGAAAVLLKLCTHSASVAGLSTLVGRTGHVYVVLNTYGQNLQTIFWPKLLVMLYPLDVPMVPTQGVVVGGLLVLTTAGIIRLLWLTKRNRVALCGMLWFVFGLLPSSQIILNQHFRADRYLYLPLVGLSIALAAAVLRPGGRRARWVVGLGLSVCVIALLVGKSTAQVEVWKDNISLYTHCLRGGDDHVAYYNRGNSHRDLGYYYQRRHENERAREHLEKALADYTKAIECAQRTPGRIMALNNRAMVYGLLNRIDAAVGDYTRAVELSPTTYSTYLNRATAYAKGGQIQRAIDDLRQVIEHSLDAQLAEEARRRLDQLQSIRP